MRGGSRPNAGRKPGSKTRKKVELSDEVAKRQEKAVGALTPLEYLTQVYQDRNEKTAIRVEAARAAALYVHLKKPTEVITRDGGKYHGEDVVLVHDATPAEGAAGGTQP